MSRAFHQSKCHAFIFNWIFALFLPAALMFSTELSATPTPAAQITQIPEKVQVGVMHFPPYFVVENNFKVLGGYFVDYVKMAFTKAGVEYEIKGYPAKRLYQNLGEGTVQAFVGLIGVPEYDGKTLVSPEKIAEVVLEIYSIEVSNSNSPAIQSIEDLIGKSVIVINGYTYGGLKTFVDDPKNKITVMETSNYDSALSMLAAGRAPYMLGYKEVTDEALAVGKINRLKRFVIKILPIHVHVSKNTPQAQILLNKLDRAFIELKAEGKMPYATAK